MQATPSHSGVFQNNSFGTRSEGLDLGLDWEEPRDATIEKALAKKEPEASTYLLFRSELGASALPADADRSEAGATPEKKTPSNNSIGNLSRSSSFANVSLGTQPSTIGLGMDW